MLQKLTLAVCGFFLLIPVVVAEEADVKPSVAEPSAAEEAEIKQAAEESTKMAEDELSKLEQTVGESSDDSKSAEADKAAKDEKSSKPWLPAAKEFDWIQLTSGEWLKGEIKSMYNKNLEFDSDKLDLLSIDWEDVKYLKSYRPSSINVEKHEPITGSLQISGDTVTITNGDKMQEFSRLDLISLTPSADREVDLWTIKFTLGLNIQSGNTDQLDYNTKLIAKRRTARSRFTVDYIGNISKTGNVTGNFIETVNNNRITANYDIYATRYFFYRPIFAEYYSDPFQNIEQRITVGTGVGYTLLDTGKYEWYVNGGPAFVTTRYSSVEADEDSRINALAIVLGTNLDAEINSMLDFIFKYNIQASEKDSGGYTHHMIGTLESELTRQLDFDISLVWDHIGQPTKDDLGIAPDPNDFRLTVGVTYEY